MEYSFPHYLLAKQTIDDRALNAHVYENLTASLPEGPLRIVEAGAGIGSMFIRLLNRGLLQNAEYIAIDEMPENIRFASDWIPRQAKELGMRIEESGKNELHLSDDQRDLRLVLRTGNILDWIRDKPDTSDLLIAHAFLDLLQLPDALGRLFALLKPNGLAWLTVNFDGVTVFEPVIDPPLEARIMTRYHETMDRRPTGGDSQTGRHLFRYLQQIGAQILAAGPSDWVVHPTGGRYPADEAYFLYFILHFFEESLRGDPNLAASTLEDWLAKRRAQIERGELVYIAHQLDFLVRA